MKREQRFSREKKKIHVKDIISYYLSNYCMFSLQSTASDPATCNLLLWNPSCKRESKAQRAVRLIRASDQQLINRHVCERDEYVSYQRTHKCAVSRTNTHTASITRCIHAGRRHAFAHTRCVFTRVVFMHHHV